MKVHNPPKPPKCPQCGLFQGFAGMKTKTCQCPEYLEKKSKPSHPLINKFNKWASEKYPSRVFNSSDKELASRFAQALLEEAAKLTEDEYVNWVVYDNHEDTINAIRDAILSLQIKQQ